MILDVKAARGARFLLVAAALVVVVYGLRAAGTILVPFALALILAVLSLPLQEWLKARRIPGPLAVGITVLANAAFLGGVLLVVGRSLEDFVTAVPRYVVALQGMAGSALDWIEGHGVPIADRISTDLISPSRVVDMVGGTLRGIATMISYTFMVLLIMVFVLAEATGFPAKVRAALGDANADLSRFERIAHEVHRYLRIKTLISLATGVLVGLWVALLDIDFPILWGLVAFLLNYVPNVGSIVAAIPPILLALVQFGMPRAAAVVAGYLAVNVTLGNLIEPNLMGRKLGLSPLVIVLSLLAWGWIWGPVGMLLSVPLTMSVKIMLEHTEDFRWIAVLLGGKPSTPRVTPETESEPAVSPLIEVTDAQA